MRNQTHQELKGLYRMTGSKNWWLRYSSEKRQRRVALRTADLAEAITRARAILAEGLVAAEAYRPNESAPRKREIHDLIERYLEQAQSRTKDPLRKVAADSRRYILQKFASDTGVNRASEITAAKISKWLVHSLLGWVIRWKSSNEATDT